MVRPAPATRPPESAFDPRRWLGIPFADRGRDRSGCDCWGLVRLVLKEAAGLELPAYDTEYPGVADRRAVSGHIAAVVPSWQSVPPGAELPGDVVVLAIAGRPLHVGVVIARPVMLHVERGLDACLERYDGPQWRHRVAAIVRHPLLALHGMAA